MEANICTKWGNICSKSVKMGGRGSDLQRRQFSTISCKNNGQNQKYRHPSPCIGHSKAHECLTMDDSKDTTKKVVCGLNHQIW